jgi:hypothetical protein
VADSTTEVAAAATALRHVATTSTGSIDQLATRLTEIQANLKNNCMSSNRVLVTTRHFLNLKFLLLRKLCDKQARFQLTATLPSDLATLPSNQLRHPSLYPS